MAARPRQRPLAPNPTVSSQALALGLGAGVGAFLLDQKLHIRSDVKRVVMLGPMLKHLKDNDPRTGRTLTNCYADAARKWPHRDAFYFIDEDRRLTFLELDRDGSLHSSFGIGARKVGGAL